MATPEKIHIDAQDTGLWKNIKQTDEAAKKASELLQHDLETHHVFFNDIGFHNHLVHHILSLYGTGADASQLQQGYANNLSYQRPARAVHPPVVEDLRTWDHAAAYLGRERHYPDFLAYFQRAMAAARERSSSSDGSDGREGGGGGWEAVLAEHALAGTPAADDLLVRLFAGILHPALQLMYGMEWRQPAIVAEALAQACVHQPDFKDLLLRAEREANERYGAEGKRNGGGGGGGGGEEVRMPRIVSLYEEIKHDPKLATAVRADDNDKIRGGLLKRAPGEMMRVLGKVKVGPEELDERTAEMFDAVLYVTASASFHPRKVNKFDFYLIHHVNLAPLFLTINAQPWIPSETKARLLEWKIRYDLLQYAGRGAPDLSLDHIKTYQPKKTGDASRADTMSRLHSFSADDGHAIKLGRAAILCEEISKEYEDCDWIMIKGNDPWTKIHHLIVDSIEAPGTTWVRNTGLDEAWTAIPDKSKL